MRFSGLQRFVHFAANDSTHELDYFLRRSTHDCQTQIYARIKPAPLPCLGPSFVCYVKHSDLLSSYTFLLFCSYTLIIYTKYIDIYLKVLLDSRDVNKQRRPFILQWVLDTESFTMIPPTYLTI